MSDTPRSDAVRYERASDIYKLCCELERDAALFKELYHREQQSKMEAQDTAGRLARDLDKRERKTGDLRRNIRENPSGLTS